VGWAEAVIAAQTFIPAVLFVPGLSSVRTVSRVAAYAVAPLAWVAVALLGRRGAGSGSFPARPWLLACAVWLGLSVFHPHANSPVSAAAQAALYVSVFAPAFWAPSVVTSGRQVRLLLAVLFLCNGLSAAVGVGQVFRPATFNPPVIPALSNQFGGQDLMYESADGRRILRPCGLTDTPGAAATAGMGAALIGLCWALRPVAAWKRLGSLALAFLGVAVIYYSHVRAAMVMLAICLAVLTALLVAQKNYRQAVLLASGGAVLLAVALAWVASSVGGAVTERFMTLVQGDPVQLYKNSRGAFVQQAFEDLLVRYPLGYGMGWRGMINAYFGDPHRPSSVWVEVMWSAWVVDGGFPLLLAYVGALGAAMFDSVRIALTCRDRELAYWAAVIVAANLSVLADCFSFVPFLAPIGVQFWLLAAALHSAARPPAGGRSRQ
jgi:hypothetical protein